MKIVVIGTRGIPHIQGGVETHCAALYPELAKLGAEVTIIRRRCYAEASPEARGLKEWQGVKLIDVYAPRRKSLEAIVHTFLAVVKARSLHPDILHIHAVGPSLMAPFARLLGMKVVMTHHGPDYKRAKWGRLARTILHLGERMGVSYSSGIIAISPAIASDVKSAYGRECTVIPNGVPAPVVPHDADKLIGRWGLQPRRYILALGRFVPEKGFDILIEAYNNLRNQGRIDPDIRLVIAGDADHDDSYASSLRRRAAAVDGVVLTGFVTGPTLQALTANAALFAMPSTHEGLPIALLEAMSYRLDVVTSDIPACRLPELTEADRFPVNDTDRLADIIAERLARPDFPRVYDMTRYSWPAIARDTLRLYQSI